MNDSNIKIIVIEDDFFSEKIMLHIGNAPDMEIIDTYNYLDDVENTVRDCVRYNPDFILIDTSANMLQYAKKLKQSLPQAILIVTTLSDDPIVMNKAMRLGVRYFISYPASEHWLNLIREVYRRER